MDHPMAVATNERKILHCAVNRSGDLRQRDEMVRFDESLAQLRHQRDSVTPFHSGNSAQDRKIIGIQDFEL